MVSSQCPCWLLSIHFDLVEREKHPQYSIITKNSFPFYLCCSTSWTLLSRVYTTHHNLHSCHFKMFSSLRQPLSAWLGVMWYLSLMSSLLLGCFYFCQGCRALASKPQVSQVARILWEWKRGACCFACWPNPPTYPQMKNMNSFYCFFEEHD